MALFTFPGLLSNFNLDRAMWIGLTDFDSDAKFIGPDGNDVEFTHWDENNPDNKLSS